MNPTMPRISFLCIMLLLASCTVYTEKRSESLSQAVFATAESIKNARFDKAGSYAEQAKRLAYPPKKQITVSPIITSSTKKITSTNNALNVKRSSGSNNNSGAKINSSVIEVTSDTEEEEQILRLVIPESLKHAKLLIENSEEWNELLQTKKFKEQLELDNANLKKLASNIDAELQRQMQFNNQMVTDLNNMQKKLVEKDLAILKRNIIIVVLLALGAAGIYLRMKGIL